MDQNKQIEQLVLTSIDTAKEMLKEYKAVIPFGIRCFNNSEDMKMNCPADNMSKGSNSELVEKVVAELKSFIGKENIFAAALVTELESDGERGIGLQIETEQTAVLFVYPFRQEEEEWMIDEPIQTEQLLNKVF